MIQSRFGSVIFAYGTFDGWQRNNPTLQHGRRCCPRRMLEHMCVLSWMNRPSSSMHVHLLELVTSIIGCPHHLANSHGQSQAPLSRAEMTACGSVSLVGPRSACIRMPTAPSALLSCCPEVVPGPTRGTPDLDSCENFFLQCLLSSACPGFRP